MAKSLRLLERNLNITNVRILLNQPNIHVNNSLITLVLQRRYTVETSFLTASVLTENYDLVKYLISQNANINVVTNGITPLFAAAKTGNIEIFKLLHNLGADINFINQNGFSILAIAAHHHSYEVIKYLIEQNTDINAVDPPYGRTYLHDLCFAGCNTEVVKFLLDKNADINAKSDCGETPISFAIFGGNVEIVKLLISRGAKFNDSQSGDLSIDSRTIDFVGNIEMIEYLVSLDHEIFDIDNINEAGQSVLHRRVLQNNQNTVDHDLDSGCDINVKDSWDQLVIDYENLADNDDYFFEIKRHIVKLISAGLTVCEENRQAVEGDFEDLKDECRKELDKMKINRVEVSHIALFDVLLMSIHYLAIRLKFAGLDSVVDKEKLRSEYPLYGGMLFYKLSRVKRRIKYLEEVENYIESILSKLGLPLTFIRELWYCFTNIELKKLVMGENDRIDKFLY